MSRYLKLSKRFIFGIVLCIACLSPFIIPDNVFAIGKYLTERAPEGKWFKTVRVEWTRDGKPTGIISEVHNVVEVEFDVESIEKFFGKPKSYFTDWKQFRELNDGQKSTLEGGFARRGGDGRYYFSDYYDAFADLGWDVGDYLHLPDFSLDLDEDGFAESPLYSAVNFYELALNYPQFRNNQLFEFGRSYKISDWSSYGFVFSLVDDIQFDPVWGYISPSPKPLSFPYFSIIADSEHETGIVSEPSTLLLLGSGLGGIIGFGRKRLFKKT